MDEANGRGEEEGDERVRFELYPDNLGFHAPLVRPLRHVSRHHSATR